MVAIKQSVQNGVSKSSIEENVLMGKKLADERNSDFGQSIIRTLSENPGFVGMIDADSGEEVTFAQMKDRSIRCALWLRKQGVGENDVVGLSTYNQINDYVPYLATLYINAIINPTHFDACVEEKQHFLETCRPKVVFACGESIDALVQIAKDKGMKCKFINFEEHEKYVSLDEILAEQTQEEIDNFKCSVPSEPRKKVCQILFSSGTTGMPKAALLTYHRMLGRQMEECGMRKGMICLWYSGFAWVTGGILNLEAIQLQCTRVIHRKFDTEKTPAVLQKYKINFIVLRPYLLTICHRANMFTRFDFPHLESIVFIGTKTNKAILEECHKSLRHTFLRAVYGTTEGAFLTSHTEKRKSIHSVGYALSGVKLRVLDPDTGAVLGPHQTGEIYYQTDNAMLGYLNDDKETKKTITEEGWLRSGDLGYYDEDGEVFIGDRLKAMIKMPFFNLSPLEFEETLMQHPAVKDCAVVGVDHPIDIERPFIFVVKNAEVSAEELIKYAASKNERYGVTGGLAFVEALPYTQSGKKHLKKLFKMAKACVEQKRDSDWSYIESKIITSSYLLTQCHQVRIFRRYNFTSVKVIHFGGTKMNRMVLEEYQKSLPHTLVAGIYGKFNSNFSKEADGMVLKQIKNCKNIDFAGCVCNGMKLKVVHLDTGAALSLNQEGQLYFRTDNAMLGYFKNPKGTESIMDENGLQKMAKTLMKQ